MIIPKHYLPRDGLPHWLRHGKNLKGIIMLQLPGPCYLATYSITSFHLTMLEEQERHCKPVIWETTVLLNILITFWQHLICCTDIQKSEAKFLFENNMTNWLVAYVLPCNCSTLSETMLYAEKIGGIQQLYSHQCKQPWQEL